MHYFSDGRTDLLPDDDVLRRNILGLSDLHFTVDRCRIQRRRDSQYDIVCIEFWIKVGFQVYRILYARLGGLDDVRLQLEW